jgi:hypothetical protein
MVGTEKYEIVAVAAIKKFKKMISEYKGSNKELKDYLLRELEKMDERADAILASIIDEII